MGATGPISADTSASAGTPASTVGSKKNPGRSGALPPASTSPPAPVASSTDSAMSSWALSLISGPRSTPGSMPGPTFTARMRAANFSANESATASWTRNRLAAMQDWPPLRILATIAPSTAASMSASSNTRNGALPPSSIEVEMIRFDACSSRVRPTSVDPVNESLRTRGSSSIAGTTSEDRRDGTTLTTPAGTPASSMSAAIASAVSGVSDARPPGPARSCGWPWPPGSSTG